MIMAREDTVIWKVMHVEGKRGGGREEGRNSRGEKEW